MEINAFEQHKIDNITPDIYVDFIYYMSWGICLRI